MEKNQKYGQLANSGMYIHFFPSGTLFLYFSFIEYLKRFFCCQNSENVDALTQGG